jgi:hypothetical protein
MTENLLTPVREEKRKDAMKRHHVPAALATTKDMAFTILCCAVLMLFATPAWADQCTSPSVPSEGGGIGIINGQNPLHPVTGCGAVITVTTVDTDGHATTFSVDASTPNGNPYDGGDDTLIGIQNSSGHSLTSLTLSSTDPIFGFDGDGTCNTLYHNPPYSWCPGASSGYEGPDNTFTVASATMGTVNFTTAIPDGGSTWFAMEGTPQSVLSFQGPVTPVSGTVNLTPNGAPVNQTASFPTGTNFGTVMSMQIIETPANPATFNSQNFPEGFQNTRNTFSGGSPVPSTTKCLEINGMCFSLVVKCFSDAAGTIQIPCTGINAGGKLINLTSQFQTPTSIHSPAVLIATDDPTPLNDWTNITTFFDPGDTCLKPPCSGGGGTKGLNTRLALADLNPGCDILTYTLQPDHGPVGTSVNVKGSLNGCQFVSGEKTLFGAFLGSLTFRLTGKLSPPGCAMQTVVGPPLPLFLPFGSKIPFSFKLKIPTNACLGRSEVTSTILSGNDPFVWSATFTVQ